LIHGKHGLGGYLFEALKKKIPVIGVAKSEFHNKRKHLRIELKKLEAVTIFSKKFKGNYPQTLCKISEKGKRRFQDYVNAISSYLKPE